MSGAVLIGVQAEGVMPAKAVNLSLGACYNIVKPTYGGDWQLRSQVTLTFGQCDRRGTNRKGRAKGRGARTTFVGASGSRDIRATDPFSRSPVYRPFTGPILKVACGSIPAV